MNPDVIILKLISVGVFSATWLLSRQRSRDLKISDIFILMLMAVYLPYFLFNRQANSIWNPLSFSEAVMSRGEVGLMTVLAIGSTVFLIKTALGRFWTPGPASRLQSIDMQLIKKTSIAAFLMAALIFASLMLFSEFRDFRGKTLEFMVGNVSGSLYDQYRNQVFTGTFLMDGVLGRLRFVAFPILFLFSISGCVLARRYLIGLVAALVLFIALPMSFAKLSFAYYFGYLGFYILYVRFGRISFVYFAIAIPVIMVLAIAGLSIIYFAQYQGTMIFANMPQNLIGMACNRIWGESYSIILRYFTVYPDQLSFTGASGINLLAKLSGIEPRMPDIEVAVAMLGPNPGSNPGIFFLGGYAAFGDTGLCVFAFLGFGILFLLDAVGERMRTQYVRSIYLAIMSMNVLFFLQVALQTALLTYGVLVAPGVLFAADHLLARYRRRERFQDCRNATQADVAP